MKFHTVLNYAEIGKNTALDYDLQVVKLKREDLYYYWEGTHSNYSLAGFKMKFKRHATKYIVDYYLPSGLFVVISWVRLSQYNVILQDDI